MTVLLLVMALSLSAGSVAEEAPAEAPTRESLAEFEERVEAAFAQVEAALAREEERLRQLAQRHASQKLGDGRASVSQAEANIHLWTQRNKELEAVKRELRGKLAGLLASLDSEVASLAGRLSVRPDTAARRAPEIDADFQVEERGVETRPSQAPATSGPPAADPLAGHKVVERGLSLARANRLLIQLGLDSLGFDAGPADGLFGPRTRAALGSWQAANGYEVTGHLTRKQTRVLLAAGEQAEQQRAAERERRERQRAMREQRDQAQAERQRKPQDAAHGEQGEPAGAAPMQTDQGRQALEGIVGSVFRDCPHCPEVVVVPPGSFRMGGPLGETGRQDNEGPQHWVEIRQAFAVGVYEVTRREYSRFVLDTNRTWSDSCVTFEAGEIAEQTGRHWQKPGYHQTERHPVVCVSWEDAQAYARWLSLQAGKPYRLLSESEWEYATRAGTATARYWGDNESDQCRHANGLDASTDFVGRSGRVGCRDGYAATSPAGAFTRNRFGLYDALGNVWEWTQDCGAVSYEGATTDGRARQGGVCGLRVVRGGSWINGPTFLRAARRDGLPPGHRFNVVGFRIARSLNLPR